MFIIQQIHGQLMNKFFFKFKKTFFCPIFGTLPLFLGAKNIFPKNLAYTTSQGFLVPCRKSEKPNDPILRKQPNRQQDGRMDRPYFMGPFWLLLGF